MKVSIPSRGFWFFEAIRARWRSCVLRSITFQSPRGDFGFLKAEYLNALSARLKNVSFNPLAGILVF